MNQHQAHSIQQVPLLELDLMKTLVAIAETGNFSAAAERVFRTPSAVSMQVKKIEELVGKPVFIRDSRSVSLTSDGEYLLSHARRMLALNNEMIANFITPEVEGEVRIGVIDHISEQFLTSALKQFKETHPAIVVDVTVENSKELAQRLRDQQLDLILVTCDSSYYGGLQVERIFKERLVWAGAKCGVAIEQNPIPISVWEDGCVWRKAALEGLDKAKFDYRISFKSAYISGQRAALEADLAIAPLPLSSIKGDIEQIPICYNLPKLPEYYIGMITSEEEACCRSALEDHLRASFAKHM